MPYQSQLELWQRQVLASLSVVQDIPASNHESAFTPSTPDPGTADQDAKVPAPRHPCERRPLSTAECAGTGDNTRRSMPRARDVLALLTEHTSPFQTRTIRLVSRLSTHFISDMYNAHLSLQLSSAMELRTWTARLVGGSSSCAVTLILQ